MYTYDMKVLEGQGCGIVWEKYQQSKNENAMLKPITLLIKKKKTSKNRIQAKMPIVPNVSNSVLCETVNFLSLSENLSDWYPF